MLRIGLLGCGRIARRFHLPLLRARRDVDVVALAEADADRLRECGALAPGATTFDDYRDLLSDATIDGAVIALPSLLHADAAVASLGRGLHVYVEKPLATAFEDADRVIDAWGAAGTVGRVGFNLRFHPLAIELREALRRGAIGDPVGFRTVFTAARRDLPEWKRERRSGGGALLDLASHHFDLIPHAFGSPIAEVSAMVRSVETEDDTAVATIRLENGVLGTVLVSIAAIEEDRIEVYGTDGGLELDRYRSRRLRAIPARRDFGRRARLRAGARTVADAPRRLGDALRPPTDPSFGRALAEFVEACRSASRERDGGSGGAERPDDAPDPGDAGPGPAADLHDGARCLAAVLAAEASARAGRRVAV